jgi:tetratricopeptide (TPR) repeat protein
MNDHDIYSDFIVVVQQIGRLFMSLREYSDALRAFQASLRLCGTHHVSWFNSGICLHHLARYDEALDAFR